MKFTWKKILHHVPLASAFVCMAAVAANEEAAASLLEKYSLLEGRLHQNQFKQPVVLDSTETGNLITGEIYAVIKHPFAEVSQGLNSPDHWCDVLSLHINTKYCRAVVVSGSSILKVNFGKKTPQRLQDAARVEFAYTTVASTASYLNLTLDAKQGALGTSDYHIEFEAAPLPNDNTFLHFTYSYSINFAARFAMRTYLATIGSNKVGFTVTGMDSSGNPQFISGVRGIMERNTMRYYLAIDSFFATSSPLPAVQLEQRLQSWFAAVEEYPVQLHELDAAEYFSMKRAERVRQQADDPAILPQ